MGRPLFFWGFILTISSLFIYIFARRFIDSSWSHRQVIPINDGVIIGVDGATNVHNAGNSIDYVIHANNVTNGANDVNDINDAFDSAIDGTTDAYDGTLDDQKQLQARE